MKKVLFVDHSFHKKTRSSEFFKEMLITNGFAVSTLYVDPEAMLDASTIPERTDVVIIWQMDYLAPLFLSWGIPTIVVPMYDGSGQMPSIHWLASGEARFISFSMNLHLILRKLRCDSLNVKYFPEVNDRSVSFSNGFNAFFWQRRPDHGLHWQYINHIIGHQLNSLHIHDAPDLPELKFAVPTPATELHYKVSISNWFDSVQDLHKLLDQHNIYIAPRISEGIGMGFLEAMARGCCVVAPNVPTHNEYIADQVNGCLFNPSSGTLLDLSRAKAMGYWARETVAEGRLRWERDHVPAIVEYVATCPKPAKSPTAYNSACITEMLSAYGQGIGNYVAALARNGGRIYSASNSTVFVRDILPFPVMNKWMQCSSEGGLGTYLGRGFSTDSKDLGVSEQGVAELIVPLHGGATPDIVLLDIVHRGTGSKQVANVYMGDKLIAKTNFHGNCIVPCVVPVEHRSEEDRILTFRIEVVSSDQENPKPFQMRGFGAYLWRELPAHLFLQAEALIADEFESSFIRSNYVNWCMASGVPILAEKVTTVMASQMKEFIAFVADRTIDNPAQARLLDKAGIDLIWRGRDEFYHSITNTVWISPITKAVYKAREDVRNVFDITTAKGLLGFLGWYYLTGAGEHGLENSYHPDEIKWLFSPADTSTSVSTEFPVLFKMLLSYRNDLADAFGSEGEESLRRLGNWLRGDGLYECAGFRSLLERGSGIVLE